MEIEFNNIIKNIKYKPSSKCIMVSIPFHMYRIETYEFEHGLNFFQKLVLKFRVKPNLNNAKIEELLGLDEKLLEIINSELKDKGLITAHNSITEDGLQKLKEVDGLIVNSGKRRMGYVFKFLNQNKIYPYLINKINRADSLSVKGTEFPRIIVGTKGDGDDYSENSIYLKELVKNKELTNKPTEKDILQLIRNTSRKNINFDGEDKNEDKLAKKLNIKYLNEDPELVWLCSYIYLPVAYDNVYDNEWRILDPFTNQDSILLKQFIQDLNDNYLNNEMKNTFANIQTLELKTISEYEEIINQKIDNKLLEDFGFQISNLGSNLQSYIRSIVRNFIVLENSNYSDIDASLTFTLNIQNALENIFKQDKEDRIDVYNRMFNELNSEKEKDSILKQIFQKRYFSTSHMIPQKIRNVSKGNLRNANSLLAYMAAFILTYYYKNDSNLYEILRNKIDIIIEIAQLRNEKGHGNTDNDRKVDSLSKDEILKYYDFIKNFIIQYTN